MGAGVSVRESVRTYSQDGSGVMPLNRSGLSLEKAASWSQDDVRTALRAVQDSESVMLLLPVLARASADGKFLLSVSEDELEALFLKEQTAPHLAAWATKAVLRLQRRQVIVGREARPPPLPLNWRAVPSRSQPGTLSFLNELTGERTRVRPTKDATAASAPLPAGWIAVPSTRWPGANVYMHVSNPNLRMQHRPAVEDPSLRHTYGSGGGGGGGGGGDTHSNFKKAVLRTMRGDLERRAAEKRKEAQKDGRGGGGGGGGGGGRREKHRLGFLHQPARLGSQADGDHDAHHDHHHHEVHREFRVSMLQPKDEPLRRGSTRGSSRGASRGSATSGGGMGGGRGGRPSSSPSSPPPPSAALKEE